MRRRGGSQRERKRNRIVRPGGLTTVCVTRRVHAAQRLAGRERLKQRPRLSLIPLIALVPLGALRSLGTCRQLPRLEVARQQGAILHVGGRQRRVLDVLTGERRVLDALAGDQLRGGLPRWSCDGRAAQRDEQRHQRDDERGRRLTSAELEQQGESFQIRVSDGTAIPRPTSASRPRVLTSPPGP